MIWVEIEFPNYKVVLCVVYRSPGYNNGQKERLCLIIDKCRRQKLCERAQKISAAAPLRVMAPRYNPCE
jgi:hypothetical protein